ncbi:MAG: LuxR C-terminal-related transcriptional regulator [Candidatus Acidiferrales bacterium]
MKKNRKAAVVLGREIRSGASTPQIFVFCEKQSGAARFQLKAGADGMIPFEEAASLLAMHCLVRGESPSDYQVMVQAAGSLFERVTTKARQLLDAGRAIACPVGLSRREKEVLDGILENLANKEIASRLYISERTVKFHVSSLFVKFKVSSRMELMRKTPGFLSTGDSLFSEKPAEASPQGAPSLVRSNRTIMPLDRRGNRVVPPLGRLLTA